MEERSIDDISYIFKELQTNNNNPRPIVFLGAGASASAGIPLTGKIITDVLEKFKDKPSIKKLNENDKNNYYKLMGALSAQERRELFFNYISNYNVKLNVTNIYLAQFLKKGLIDYVLTVNFDDLILKACAMFNFIPPVYDVAILNDFTTTTFLEKSVTYLHGQHHGQWLLNIEDELKKVEDSVLNILKSICHKRTWIIIGYSGEDTVFDNICKLGSFQNELYWVGYRDNEPSQKVKENLLNKPRTNAYWVKGYDSDSFFLKLHSSLNLDTPEIFNKPFSFLESMMNNVTDIDLYDISKEHKDLFDDVKERMNISKKWVKEAIVNIEQKHSIENLKQEIIEASLKGVFNFDFIRRDDVQKNLSSVNVELSQYYHLWGNKISDNTKGLQEESIYEDIISKYKKATELNEQNSFAFNNLGNSICRLARFKGDASLFEESFSKYEKASLIDNSNSYFFNNWGSALSDLGKLTKNVSTLKLSFEKFIKAIGIDNSAEAYYNWGWALIELSRLENNDELLSKEGFLKIKIATELNPNNYYFFYNWGTALFELGKLKSDKIILKESIEKLQQATKLNFKYNDAINNLGAALSELGNLENNRTLLKQSLYEFDRATKINSQNYLYFGNWGTSLLRLAKLENSIILYTESILKFEDAIKLNSNFKPAYTNLSTALLNVSYLYSESNEKLQVLQKAKDVATKIYNDFNSAYNLACINILLGHKAESLKYLKESLDENEISREHVLNDRDWNSLKDDGDFLELFK